MWRKTASHGEIWKKQNSVRRLIDNHVMVGAGKHYYRLAGNSKSRVACLSMRWVARFCDQQQARAFDSVVPRAVIDSGYEPGILGLYQGRS